ncbi:GlsB/YeaQ/YmgE family stress response membrane protein [uncultured Acinetobacter sp.]|uniref:GlsB/YeaQ/YmgE family stress response membrane protein n=1 Tax=uncultured Acinetobacter sp. TaxID=165433 RepID=UPI00258F4FAE|nr:GlsB/YeaQ/YmgE family stress response membrane protein [uncultured Acinetobacter sp.]
MWSLIVAIVVGFIAGLIARAIHPGDDKAGFIVTTLLGIAGSLLATYGGRLLGLYSNNSNAGFIASVIGAIVILFIYNLITKRSNA